MDDEKDVTYFYQFSYLTVPQGARALETVAAKTNQPMNLLNPSLNYHNLGQVFYLSGMIDEVLS